MQYRFSEKISALKPSAIREILKNSAGTDVIPFSAGNPAPEAFPIQAVSEITAEILAKEPVVALQYGITEGYAPLRDVVQKRMRERWQVGGDEDELLVVSGAQQGIELACKVLCNEGDTVICEEPSFVGALNSFRSLGAKLEGVPLREDGPDTQALERILANNNRVRLIYLIPNFQNPSGVTTSFEKRKEIYRLACQYDVMILEDNPYGELRFIGQDVPAIKTLDREGRVIYCGSFSKTLSPGLRVGYVIANSQMIAKLTVAKQGEDVHTPMLPQMVTYRFLTEYDYEAHLVRLRAIYKEKAALMCGEIERHFSQKVRFIRPQGGLFLWASLPEGCDMTAFCKTAAASGVAVVPGSAFLPDEEGLTQSFRLNYSTPTDDQIRRGVEILGTLTQAL